MDTEHQIRYSLSQALHFKFELAIFFKIRSTKLSPRDISRLAQVVKYAKGHPDELVEIDGYSDNIPLSNPQYNLKLSQKRANFVKKYMARRGVRLSRMIVKAFGMEYPIASNATIKGRAKNRRVELCFFSKQAIKPDAGKEKAAGVLINQFLVKGNTLLPAAKIESLLNHFKGKKLRLGDIRLAMKTLDGAYLNAGFSPVRVTFPAQSITSGTVILVVDETLYKKSLAEESASDNGNTAPIRIDKFLVKGNTLLVPAQIDRLLEPFKGENRTFTDIQFALEALEGAYRTAGYSAVHVVIPEQEVTEGTVIFEVDETVIGKVNVKGNKYYDLRNIRNALPALMEGTTPSARKLAENIRLANENPTRKLEVVLAVGEEENTVDANVNVEDSSPHKIFATLDNTGSQSTGLYRTGINYQNNNLFNSDHAATLGYTTSPDHIQDVTSLTGSYRWPLYSLGDSADFIAAHSDTNAGTSPIVGGYTLAFSGKGDVYGAHYNHNMPNNGDYTSKIIAGLDERIYINNCLINGAAICGSSGSDLTVRPISLTYNGTLTKPSFVIDYSTSVSHNIPGGANGNSSDFVAAKGEGASANYSILKLNGSVTGVLPKEWQYRIASNLQYTRDPLVTYENFGLVGANAVRGYLEREVANDEGVIFNFEAYTPELAPRLNIKEGSFRLLAFVDRGYGWSVPLPGAAEVQNLVGSFGTGVRSSYKNVTAKFDVASVINAAGSKQAGDIRGTFSMMVSW